MVTRSDATPNVRKSLLLKGFRRPKRSWLPEGKERRKLRCFQDKAAKIGRITRLRDISVLKLRNQEQQQKISGQGSSLS